MMELTHQDKPCPGICHLWEKYAARTGWLTRSRVITASSVIAMSSLFIAYNYIQSIPEVNIHPTYIHPWTNGKPTNNDVRSLTVGRNVRHRLQANSHYSCFWHAGGIGNLLFQYASVFGLSQPHNLSVIVGLNDELFKIFELGSAIVVDDRDICETTAFVTLKENKCCSFNSTIAEQIKPDTNYQFIYYLQSWKYFTNVAETVRNEFTFRSHIKDPATDIIENYRRAYDVMWSANTTVVGLHIRRGDILDEAHRNLGWEPTPETYIHKAIDYFVDGFKHVLFVVCSDDMHFSKNVSNYRNISVEHIHVLAVIDFAILSMCDHVITTFGSFGWWAGYLSNGTVVYYKYPMVEGSVTRHLFNYADYFLPDWIGL